VGVEGGTGGHPHGVTAVDDALSTLAQTFRGYDTDGEVNLVGYAGSLAAYAGSLGVLVAASRAAGQGLPEAYPVRDLVIGGVAVHKFSRVLSKSSVASPLRAPFTEFERAAGSAEHHESARGEHGVRHTIGELLTCPFCLGVWLSTAYVVGLALAPRPTRAWAALFTVTAISDGLQQVYARLRAD
jgi:hypothetical protein